MIRATYGLAPCDPPYSFKRSARAPLALSVPWTPGLAAMISLPAPTDARSGRSPKRCAWLFRLQKEPYFYLIILSTPPTFRDDVSPARRSRSGSFLCSPRRHSCLTPLTPLFTSPYVQIPEVLVQGHTDDVFGMAFHPKKPHKFATVCDSSNVFLWNAKRRQLMVRAIRVERADRALIKC